MKIKIVKLASAFVVAVGVSVAPFAATTALADCHWCCEITIKCYTK